MSAAREPTRSDMAAPFAFSKERVWCESENERQYALNGEWREEQPLQITEIGTTKENIML